MFNFKKVAFQSSVLRNNKDALNFHLGRHVAVWAALFLILQSCGVQQRTKNNPENTDSKAKFVVSSQWFIPAGHELLTHLSAINANRIIGREFYSVSPKNSQLSGYQSQNPLIRGVYLADHPLERKNHEVDLGAFENIAINDEITDWHDADVGQKYHFLRARHPLQSVLQACNSAIDTINKLSLRARQHFFLEQSFAENLLGVALHVIQDSFSTAHAKRDEQGKVVDICTWKDSMPNICYHSVFDVVTKDLVLHPEQGNAGQAVTAGIQYLWLMEQFLKGNINEQNLYEQILKIINC